MTQRQKLKTVIPLSKNLQFWLELSVSLWYMLKLMHNKSCSYSTSIIVYSLNIHVSMPNVVCSMKITFNNRNIIWSFFYFDINTYFILRVSIIEPYAWYENFYIENIYLCFMFCVRVNGFQLYAWFDSLLSRAIHSLHMPHFNLFKIHVWHDCSFFFDSSFLM